MKNNKPADRVCGVKLSSLLPLISEESWHKEIAECLRSMVLWSHPNILKEIPNTVSLYLTPKYTGKVTKTTPEALLLVSNYFEMVVFVTNLNKGGKVIGAVWAHNPLVWDLFGYTSNTMINEALSTSSRPNRNTWEKYCMNNPSNLSPIDELQFLNKFLKRMEEESEKWHPNRRL